MSTSERNLRLSSLLHGVTALGLLSLGACIVGPEATATCEVGTDCDATDGPSAGGSTSGADHSDGSSSSAGSTDATSPGDASTGGADDPSSSTADSAGVDTECTSGSLTLRRVSVFQTVEVPLVEDCAEVGLDERIAPVIAGRTAMLRATVDVAPAPAQSELAVRVDLASDGGEETLTGPCETIGPDGGVANLHVALPATSLPADTDYSVSIVRCDDEGAVVGFPGSGAVALGLESSGTLRLHVVPFEVGGFVPDTSAAVIDGFRNAILAHYPVTDVEITVLAVEADDNDGQVDMGHLMSRLIQLQEDFVFASGDLDPDLADVYYYGLVTGAATRDDFCDSCPTGTSESGVGDRAGSAMGAAFGDALSESTLVHELGHMHGLLHSPCGSPSLQDEDFPFPDGGTHTEGWDFRTGEFVPADRNDLMGYCQPRWVSAYHYRKMADWVQLALSWSGGAAAPPPTGTITRASCFVGR